MVVQVDHSAAQMSRHLKEERSASRRLRRGHRGNKEWIEFKRLPNLDRVDAIPCSQRMIGQLLCSEKEPDAGVEGRVGLLRGKVLPCLSAHRDNVRGNAVAPSQCHVVEVVGWISPTPLFRQHRQGQPCGPVLRQDLGTAENPLRCLHGRCVAYEPAITSLRMVRPAAYAVLPRGRDSLAQVTIRGSAGSFTYFGASLFVCNPDANGPAMLPLVRNEVGNSLLFIDRWSNRIDQGMNVAPQAARQSQRAWSRIVSHHQKGLNAKPHQLG